MTSRPVSPAAARRRAAFTLGGAGVLVLAIACSQPLKFSKDDSAIVLANEVASLAGTGRRAIEFGAGLGLRRMHHTVELENTPEVRGMINKISYMVKCEEV